MYKRFIERKINEALSDTPVVLVVGPRRVGKTTHVKKLEDTRRTYVTMDDQTTLDAARSDPVGFVRGLDLAIIDEIQRAPELLLAIKMSVDEDYRPGRFLLTGSANVMTLPKVEDSLAGRIEIIQMLPLARAEIEDVSSTFLDRLFDGSLKSVGNPVVGDELIRLVLLGGYPEAIVRKNERRRQIWAKSYLSSILARDLIDIGTVQKLAELPKFTAILAQYSGQLVNYSKMGSRIGFNYKTSQRYTTLLEQVFLVSTLQPWYTNTLKRIVKTPKLHFLDSCLLATELNLNFEHIRANRVIFGKLLESFVYSEILKLIGGTDLQLSAYHFRDAQQHEVDLVLERGDGMIAGVEIKASATVNSRDFAGLRSLAAASKGRFASGIVLYDSTNFVPFRDDMAAVPISSLWS